MRHFKRSGKFYVYIVQCLDGTYYTGYTNDLENRLRLHNSGKGAKYTRSRRPVKLVWSRKYRFFRDAFLEEKRIQSLARQEKIELVDRKRPAAAR